jgi:subtilisin family serine protease
MGRTDVLVYYGEPSPFNPSQEIYFDFIPREDYVESGIWQITLKAGEIVDGTVHFWLPSSSALNRATRFLKPVPDTTLTIPSTALRPITVGAYDDSNLTYAAFSGRGDTRLYRIPKPDISAPGVGIITTKNGGGYAPVTGTSFAAPFVTGSAALLMEWGIVRGNDAYLYGEKVKAYLRKGARPLPGFDVYPNPQVGWGALCVRDSLPM